MDLESPELIKAIRELRSRVLSTTPEIDIQVMNVRGPEICETQENADLDFPS